MAFPCCPPVHPVSGLNVPRKRFVGVSFGTRIQHWYGAAAHLTSKTPPLASQESLEALRHNTGKKHAEGMEHITSQLRKQARHANAVDVSLHQFVSAKFCELLQELDLTEHPLVLKELSTYNKLGKR